ncbi:uncharacterized protein LOC113855916 [Abrus precatorius]|uniref:Uncharacterized protein LOC113855916 n=1 Tax=Abrus precatorius TaxID=3816 RepID=A0A8B8KHR8_ABRPR|nr:uncharacterized protein LOC113855916 [Abrus precatorius]
MKVTETLPYGVELGTGTQLQSKKVCEGVRLDVQGVAIVQTFYLIKLGSVDIVLGMEWLQRLGTITANFYQLYIKWQKGAESRMIRGDASLGRKCATLKTTLKALKEEGGGILVTAVGPEVEAPSEILDVMRKLQEEFEDIGTIQKGLPPVRTCDHAIILKEGAVIPHIRPYRYPHSQKNEIDKLVDEMLEAGIIKPSISPYSRPVLLGRRRMEDGGSALTTEP